MWYSYGKCSKNVGESDLSIKKSQLNGYDDYFYFNKVFKELLALRQTNTGKSIRSETMKRKSIKTVFSITLTFIIMYSISSNNFHN